MQSIIKSIKMNKHYMFSNLYKGKCEIYKSVCHTVHSGCHLFRDFLFQTGTFGMIHGQILELYRAVNMLVLLTPCTLKIN